MRRKRRMRSEEDGEDLFIMIARPKKDKQAMSLCV